MSLVTGNCTGLGFTRTLGLGWGVVYFWDRAGFVVTGNDDILPTLGSGGQSSVPILLSAAPQLVQQVLASDPSGPGIVLPFTQEKHPVMFTHLFMYDRPRPLINLGCGFRLSCCGVQDSWWVGLLRVQPHELQHLLYVRPHGRIPRAAYCAACHGRGCHCRPTRLRCNLVLGHGPVYCTVPSPSHRF